MSSFENTLDEQSPTLLNDNNNLVNQKDHTEGMVNNVGGKNHIGLSPNRKDSFGGKFFNFARSFASGNSQLHDQDERVFISSKSRSTITGSSSKTYHQDFCDSTLDGLKPRLVSNNSEVVRGTEFIRSIPFPLILLAELSFENSFRFVLFGQSILDFLCDLAAGIGDSIKSDSPNVRLFAMNVLTNLVTSGLSGIADSNDMGCSKQRYKLVGGDVEVVDDCLRTTQESKDNIVDNEDEYLSLKKMSHVDLLSPLCRAISGTEEIDTANEALKSLHMIIEGVGHNLKTTDIWVQIIDSISTLAGSPPSSSNIITPALPPLLCKNRFSAEWSGCSALAFQLLKLIVDDFLDELPSSPQSSSRTMRTALLDCCAAFGCSMHDINTSLTATGMLWTIADQNSTLSSLDHLFVPIGSMSKLALLASDSRAEVRNCSVNTLFSCIIGLGDKFTTRNWQSCINNTIFGILDEIDSRGPLNNIDDNIVQNTQNKSDTNRYNVSSVLKMDGLFGRAYDFYQDLNN